MLILIKDIVEILFIAFLLVWASSTAFDNNHQSRTDCDCHRGGGDKGHFHDPLNYEKVMPGIIGHITGRPRRSKHGCKQEQKYRYLRVFFHFILLAGIRRLMFSDVLYSLLTRYVKQIPASNEINIIIS